MLSGVLRSSRPIQVNKVIMRTFVVYVNSWPLTKSFAARSNRSKRLWLAFSSRFCRYPANARYSSCCKKRHRVPRTCRSQFRRRLILLRAGLN